MDMEEIRKQLDRLEVIAKETQVSAKRTEQAVFGDQVIGLNGLVNDMKEMKSWRSSITVKTGILSGVVAGGVVGAKTLLAKLFGGS